MLLWYMEKLYWILFCNCNDQCTTVWLFFNFLMCQFQISSMYLLTFKFLSLHLILKRIHRCFLSSTIYLWYTALHCKVIPLFPLSFSKHMTVRYSVCLKLISYILICSFHLKFAIYQMIIIVGGKFWHLVLPTGCTL